MLEVLFPKLWDCQRQRFEQMDRVEVKAKFSKEKHITHGTRVPMIKLSLSFVSLECSLHCARVQFATWGLFPLHTSTSPPYTKGQVWPSDPPPNSPLIMLFRSHWHHEYWSDEWNNDRDSCVNYCLILFPHPPLPTPHLTLSFRFRLG